MGGTLKYEIDEETTILNLIENIAKDFNFHPTQINAIYNGTKYRIPPHHIQVDGRNVKYLQEQYLIFSKIKVMDVVTNHSEDAHFYITLNL